MEIQTTTYSDLTRLAFALARYRADHGSHPAKLGDLSQKYIDAIPKDVFNNDAPLHYSREGDGYLLYSIGRNGINDGGRDDYDEKTRAIHDDIVVRVPAMKK